MSEKLREMMDGARFAFGTCEGQEIKGRRPDIEAGQVSEIAGLIYRDVTGKRPTCTTDPFTGSKSGRWPDFLRAVFEGLGIKASVDAQARVVSETMRTNSPL